MNPLKRVPLVLCASLTFAQATPLFTWNFETQQIGEPVSGKVEPLGGSVRQVPLHQPDSGLQPTIVGVAPDQAEPALTRSASFDASSGQFLRSVDMEKSLNFAFGDPFTVEAWVRPKASMIAHNPHVVGNRDPARGTSGFSLFLIDQDGELFPAFIVNSDGRSVFAKAHDPVPAGTWVHLAGTRNVDGLLTIYVNGVESASSKSHAQPGDLISAVNLTVDQSPQNLSDDLRFNGEIATVRISEGELDTADFQIRQ